MSSPRFVSVYRPSAELEPGDVYLWPIGSNLQESREVLGVLAKLPDGALLEVRKPSGDVVRSTLYGRVDVLEAVA